MSQRSLTFGFGLFGFLGAFLMYVGDLMFFGAWGDGAAAGRYLEVIASRDPQWLVLGGLLAVPAGMGYLVGLSHLLKRMAPAPAMLARLAAMLLGLLFVLTIATHAVWGGYALVVHGAAADPALEGAQAILRGYLDELFQIGQWLAIPACLLVLGLTLWGRTGWPRWMALFNPAVLYIVLGSASWLPAPLGQPIAGGGFNLAFALFFLASLLSDQPWKPAKEDVIVE